MLLPHTHIWRQPYTLFYGFLWILARRKVYTAVKFKNYFISHVAKNKIMTDGIRILNKHKFMHLEWTAPDVQNVTSKML